MSPTWRGNGDLELSSLLSSCSAGTCSSISPTRRGDGELELSSLRVELNEQDGRE